MSLGQNVVAQSTGPDDTLAQGPAPTVSVPFSWSDPSSVWLWMQNDNIITGVPDWILYAGTGLALFSMLKNRKSIPHSSSSHRRKKK
jgi:hypothetical protein